MLFTYRGRQQQSLVHFYSKGCFTQNKEPDFLENTKQIVHNLSEVSVRLSGKCILTIYRY